MLHYCLKVITYLARIYKYVYIYTHGVLVCFRHAIFQSAGRCFAEAFSQHGIRCFLRAASYIRRYRKPKNHFWAQRETSHIVYNLCRRCTVQRMCIPSRMSMSFGVSRQFGSVCACVCESVGEWVSAWMSDMGE